MFVGNTLVYIIISLNYKFISRNFLLIAIYYFVSNRITNWITNMLRIRLFF